MKTFLTVFLLCQKLSEHFNIAIQKAQVKLWKKIISPFLIYLVEWLHEAISNNCIQRMYAPVIALHQNVFTWKEATAKDIAAQRIVCLIMKNFKVRRLVSVKKVRYGREKPMSLPVEHRRFLLPVQRWCSCGINGFKSLLDASGGRTF